MIPAIGGQNSQNTFDSGPILIQYRDMNDTKSLCELMNECVELSWELCYKNIAPDGTYLKAREDFSIFGVHADTISAWADGLYHKYYNNVSTGHCSVNEMIKFDIEQFELKVIETIELFESLLIKHGRPVQLTHDDMKRMGYRGAWAGYTKEEDRQYHLARVKEELEQAEKKLQEYKNRPEKQQTYDGIWDLQQNVRGWKKEVEHYEKINC